MSLVRIAGIAGVLMLAACGGDNSSDGMWSALDEANLDAQPPQVCTPGQPNPRACDPANTKKTTVCHIPPGNPANEHTICVGNAAVPAHLAHGDNLGSCCANGGGGGSGGGGGGTGGTGGSGGGGAGGGGGGDGGAGGGRRRRRRWRRRLRLRHGHDRRRRHQLVSERGDTNMRAHVELTPAERQLLTTLTAEERQVVVAQMIETEYEELEWQIAVERARSSVAETIPARVTGVAPPPPPHARTQQQTRPQQARASSARPRWTSYAARFAAAKR